MSVNQIHIIVFILAVIFAALCFALLLVLALNYHPQQAAVRVYERIHSRLQEKRGGIFDYRKLEAFLTSHGARFHLAIGMEPLKYTALRLVLAAVGFLFGMTLHWALGIMVALLCYQAPKIYLYYENVQDNSSMVPSLQILYNALSVQIRAGVYVTDALTECYDKVTNRRLQAALRDLAGDIIMKAEFTKAMERFQRQFENHFIDSLCVILIQAKESGQSVDLLTDMSEQLKDMQAALLLRRKGRLDRATTLCTMGVFAAILAVVIYACVTSMFTAAISF